jgi:arabinogalactan oligomer / maltooligosaccharide transport system permease protein
MIIKVVLLGISLAVAIAVSPPLLAADAWAGLVAVWVIEVALLVVYSTSRLQPAKYLLPGTVFLVSFVVYPIVFLASISLTNYGDGHRSTKQDTIATIINNSVQQVPDSKRYNLSVATKGSLTQGPFVFFLVDPANGQVQLGDTDGLHPVDPGNVSVEGNRVRRADGYTILTPKQINAAKAVREVAVPVEGGAIRALGVGSAFEGRRVLEYDQQRDQIRNSATGETYRVATVGGSSYFVRDDGTRAFDQGWKEGVGLANYERALTDPVIRSRFVAIFAWTMAFAFLSVATTFLLGLGLASVLNDPRVRGRKLYRSLLLLPYAIPGFISLLVWRSFYNRDFGLINQILHVNVNWFGNPWYARAAILITNLWMGFPYMLLVCTGALQAIPTELREAAAMDGASGFVAFRRVVFPLLLVAVAPLLVASFAFNFNNFNAIRLLTDGSPFSPDNPTAGSTDILISYIFRLAFGSSGAQFGFAAAVSVLLFILTGLIAAAQFRQTRLLEEVR